MYSSLSKFKQNIVSVRELATLHDYLCGSLKGPFTFDDLLRFQIVYAVSALDKLIHDIVRIGMIGIFTGIRTPTTKYLCEKISLSAYATLSAATIPPKEFYFEQEIIAKFRFVSFQSPENIADGLSYIWEEKHKWQKIAAAMAMDEDEIRTQLRLVIDRRNKIVHEADVDIASGAKFGVTKTDCEAIVPFLERCGEEIVKLVA